MRICAFRPEDRADYLEMAADFYQGDGTLFPIDTKQIEDTFDQALAAPSYLRGCLLKEEGRTAGYALLVIYWSCEAGGLTVMLDELYIRPDFRGRGIGSQFMDWLLHEYQDQARRFRLEVCPKNERVIRLYERYGFQPLPYIQMVREQPAP